MSSLGATDLGTVETIGILAVTDFNLKAPSFALLQASMACWKCGSGTLVTAIWVARLTEFDEEGELEVADAAVLQYVESLDAAVQTFVVQSAPLLRIGRSRTAGSNYWANHCSHCDALQGDHFVMGVNGPFFFQSQEELASLTVRQGGSGLRASAGYSESGWMTQIPRLLGGAK